MLWPPLRTAIGNSSSRAKRIAAATSSALVGPDDELRVAVDHPVPHDAGLVVAGVVAADDLPGEHIGEAADCGGGWRHAGDVILRRRDVRGSSRTA